MKSLEILKKLISFDTVLDKDNLALNNWLTEFLLSHGFIVEKVWSSDKKRANLWAYKKGESGKWLYFSGHTDTVPAGSNWRTDPWKLEIRSDKLYGLGSCDMKGGIAAFLEAATSVETDLSLGLIFTYAEETDFEGITDFFKVKKLVRAPVVIAEPTSNQPIIAHKGMLSFVATFKGKAAHSSFPSNGVNAIVAATEFITELRAEAARKLKQKNNYFSPTGATNNPAIISGGDAINKIPAECVLRMEFRLILPEQIIIVKKIIKSLALKYRAKIIFDFSLSPMLCQNKKLIRLAEAATGRLAGGLNYATEAVVFAENKMDAIIIGPGPMNAHLANEYVSRRSLEEAVEIYKKIIKSI
jgi:acetylornithine deacetylase